MTWIRNGAKELKLKNCERACGTSALNKSLYYYPLKKTSSITTIPMDITRDTLAAFQSDGTGSVHEVLLSNPHTGLHVPARIAATSIANTRLKMFGTKSVRLNIKT